MDIDPKTKIFTNLTDAQCIEMVDWATDVILRGVIPQPEPEWVGRLMHALGGDVRPHNRLMYLSMVLPQRVLLAVVRHVAWRGEQALDGVTR